METKSNRGAILDTAKEYVTRDRAQQHGQAENNFGIIAALWSAYLGFEIKAHDVAAMMVAFKLGRYRSNPKHLDNAIDVCGYGSLMGELGAEAGE